jgi:ribosomal protection tetracycline resistance protein
LTHTLNLGIVAHVDAGKTSLTERLLYTAGVIDKVGSVDDGDTQTDSLDLERQRGITIKAAVVSFPLDDVTVNLIDTPGHPDFIAEVERCLSVLDGAILVVSAVEGVQAQTRVLMRALHRLGIPTLIFVNKMDRPGAQGEALLPSLSERLAPAVIDRSSVFFGSAITGEGITELIAGITKLLPARDVRGPLSGTVFKVERGRSGEKIAYVRMFAGTIRVRDRLDKGKVTALAVFDRGAAVRRQAVTAGQIAQVWGLDVRIGDAIGEPRPGQRRHFSPPTLETVIVPVHPGERGALHAALTQLAEQDPLINLRLDELREETALSLYGEVQKEVIQATLIADYGIEVVFRETTMICVERLNGTGEAVEHIGKDGNPFLATVGLRIEPASVDSGVAYRLGVELGAMPLAYFNAIEETVRSTLAQGIHGWRVTDCVVTVTHVKFAPPVTTAADFRNLTPLVLMTALSRAGTTVHEPTHSFRLDIPTDVLGQVLPVLARLRAVPRTTAVTGASAVVEGAVPAANVHGLQRELPALTRGEGVLESTFDLYRPVSGRVPSRPRSDHNPLHRKEYLLHVVRRT